MKKERIIQFIFLICILLLSVGRAFSQQYQEAVHFNLNQILGYDSYEYVARDYVSLKPGFRYTAQNPKEFRARLDESMIFPIEDSGFPDYDRDIDANNSVGTIPGNLSVSETGAAIYSIPVIIPPGTAGIQPNITISYNSHVGSGLLGMGWNITGLSIISRVEKNIYRDGLVEPVTLDPLDELALDGNRLINVGNNQYRTANESFNLIIANDNIGGDPEWFLVKTKNGLSMEYGRTPDSRYKDGNVVIFWRLNKIYDTYGNYMTYEYVNDNNSSRITKINYTGNENSNMQPYNAINFFYYERADKDEYYLAGKLLKQENLLRQIKISSDSKVVRRYKFEYTNNFFSYLTGVTLVGSENQELNSTIFQYGEDNNEKVLVNGLNRTGLPISVTSSGKNMVFYPGDFNGDGRTDLLGLEYSYAQASGEDEARYISWGIYLHKKEKNSGFEFHSLPFQTTWLGLDGSFRQFTKGNMFPIEGIVLLIGDLNGDTKDDIVIGTRGNTENMENYNKKYYYYHALLSTTNSTGFDFQLSNKVVKLDQSTATDWFSTISKYHAATLGDFDGDGRKELFGINTRTFDYQVESFDGRISFFVQKDLDITNIQSPQILPVDYDGDGTTELILSYNQSTSKMKQYIDLNVNNGQQSSCVWVQSIQFNTVNILNGDTKTRTDDGVDFNGDGLTDLFVTDQADYRYFWISKGRQSGIYFSEASFEKIQVMNTLNMSGKNFFVDINSDGKTDIVTLFPSEILLSLVKGKYGQRETFSLSSSLGWDSQSVFNFGDFDGDGDVEMMAKNTDWCCIDLIDINSKASPYERSLIKVVDGLNNSTRIEYSTLALSENYTSDEPFSYPVVQPDYPQLIVTGIYTPNGLGGEDFTSYNYYNARVHEQGKGFLGFLKTETYNISSGLKQYIHYEQNNDYYYLTPETLLTRKLYGSLSTLLAETILTDAVVDYGNKRIFQYTATKKSTDALTGIITTETNSFNNDGNLSYSKLSYENGFDIVTENQYHPAATWWIPSLVKEVKVTNSEPGKDDYIRIVSFPTYNDKGRLMTQIKDSGKEKSVTMQNEYNNPFGLLTKTTISASGLNSRHTSMEYEPKGRFLKKMTNTLGYAEETNYDFNGQITSTVSINGLKTTYSYDGFGTMINSKAPNGVETVFSKEWETGGTQPNAVYYSTITTEGSPDEKIWYDGLGRNIMTETDGVDGKVYSEIEYYTDGKVKRFSDPYFNGDVKRWTTYNYSPLHGYLREKTYESNTTILHIYGMNSWFTYPDGRMDTKTIDPVGRMIEETDPGGTINYSYYTSGQLKDIQYGENTWSIEYDEYGRQRFLHDPDAGTTEYMYDAFDQLLYQIDNKGNRSDFIYDDLGRVLFETIGANVTSYLYENSGGGLGLIKKKTAPNGFAKDYVYNELGFLSSVKENIQGSDYETKFTYDNFGNLARTNYPSGYYSDRAYNSKGYLTEITDPSAAVIWGNNITDAKGRTTEYTNGNGITTQMSFTAYDMPESKVAGAVFNRYNHWNAINGHLMLKKDLVSDLILEQYEQDWLGRLKKCKRAWGTGLFNLDITYDNNGKIKSKTGIGDYYYDDPLHAHAVSGVDNTNDIISDLEQTISYTDFNKTASIIEGNYELNYDYGADKQRKHSILLSDGDIVREVIYSGNYEKIEVNGVVYDVHYIYGNNGLTAINVRIGNNDNLFYVYTDYLGSIHTLTDVAGNIVYKQDFDAWGRERNPVNWSYSSNPYSKPDWLIRGYTGHEMIPELSLINMNGRMYDPLLGSMLSPDNFVQGTGTQGLNRYSYALNNPITYVDPDGNEPVVAAVIIGAVVGAYIGGTMANQGENNPVKWDYNSGTTYGYMIGGAVVGGLSGYAGGTIAAAGGFMANTASIAYSSAFYSMGMSAVTQGQVQPSVSFGAASYSFGTNEWGYLGKEGNSTMEDIGYGLGAIANISDILAGLNPATVDYRAENAPVEWNGKKQKIDWISHAQVNDPKTNKPIIDWTGRNGLRNMARNGSPMSMDKILFNKPILVNGLNKNTLYWWKSVLEKTEYNQVFNNCSQAAARGYTLSGVPVLIGFHPWTVYAQLYLRSIGIRPSLYSYYFTTTY